MTHTAFSPTCRHWRPLFTQFTSRSSRAHLQTYKSQSRSTQRRKDGEVLKALISHIRPSYFRYPDAPLHSFVSPTPSMTSTQIHVPRLVRLMTIAQEFARLGLRIP